MTEIARHKTRSEPDHEIIDAENGQEQPLGEHAGVRYHIGASLPEYPDATTTGDERVSGSDDVTLRHLEPVERNVAAASYAIPSDKN
jgi:hypothetical protein